MKNLKRSAYPPGLEILQIRVPFTRRFRAKSRRERFVPLDPDLKRWLQSLGRDIGPVFTTRRRYRGPGHTRRVRRLLDCRKLLAEIERSVGFAIRPHDCRHSFASALLDQGVDMRYVQAVLGHRSITTTETYSHLRRDYLETVKAAMARASAGGKCPESVPRA